jgi:amino acid transporter
MKNLLTKLFGADIEVPNIPCADGSCSDANIAATIIIWAYVIIGLVAVVILIIAGVQYITSEGEPEKTKRAQATITYTVIGLIVATAAAAIISFVTGAFS